MKNLFIGILLFFCFQSFTAQEVEKRYYNPGQTQAEVQKVFYQFADHYIKDGYEVTVTKKITDQDQTVQFVLKYEGGLSTLFTVRYQFFYNRVVCTVGKAHIATNQGTFYPLTPDGEFKYIKEYYFTMKKNLITAIFDYLEINNNKEPVLEAS